MSVSLQEFQDGLKVSFKIVEIMSINQTYNCSIKYKIVGFIFSTVIPGFLFSSKILKLN